MKSILSDNVEDYFVTLSDGEVVPMEERILARLLGDDVLFSNERDYYYDGEPEGKIVVLFVNCNDLFAWGCADAEDLPYEQLGPLLRMHMAGKWGSDKWCCKQRNERPQKPVEKRMREDGAWDEMMEALPPNKYDTARSEGKDWVGAINAMGPAK